ncbi:Ferritin/ribonucleotide reductase-like protein [Artemisia annua]|uniref:Ferritin/ribonucleotide reductase-like protein n=1 Tax=Artemisia annua TaxID=35608 RepID=A0A2U1L238_ARTAN|nr:Ferritin/ribonucleotide reductase-like protein [Artemisia annua]
MFFADFAYVADDEIRHFAWCSQRLAELGFSDLKFHFQTMLLIMLSYGDMPAHNLLWRECEKSSDDVVCSVGCDSTCSVFSVLLLLRGCLEAHLQSDYATCRFRIQKIRMGLVNMEARGLDAGPRVVQKLIGFGDCRTSNIFAKIAEEEVAHVAVDLLKEYSVEVKGPFSYTSSSYGSDGTNKELTIREKLVELVGDRDDDFNMRLGKKMKVPKLLTVAQKRNIKRQSYKKGSLLT